MGLFLAMAAACPLATHAGVGRLEGVVGEPRLRWTVKGASVSRPFPIMYRYPGDDHLRHGLIRAEMRGHGE